MAISTRLGLILVLGAHCFLGAQGQTTPCQDGVIACQTTFLSAVVAAGDNTKAQCDARLALLACLDTKMNSAVCQTEKSMIESMKSKFATQMSDLGCTNAPVDPTTRCQNELTKCEKTYLAAAIAAGNTIDDQCNAASAYIACLDTQLNASECQSSRSEIETKRGKFATQLSVLGCNGISPDQTTNCHDELTACEKTYLTSAMAAGDNINDHCNAAFDYLMCLNASVCPADSSEVEAMRAKFATQMSVLGCTPVSSDQCQEDFTACSNTYVTSAKAAGDDISAHCNASSVLIECLDASECKSERALFENMRNDISTQISALGCDGADNPLDLLRQCTDDLAACQKTYEASAVAAGSNIDDQCKASAVYISCVDTKEITTECQSVNADIEDIKSKFAILISALNCKDAPPQ